MSKFNYENIHHACRLAVVHSGLNGQIIKLGEEFGELCKASKTPLSFNFLEEIVDCQIVLDSIICLCSSKELQQVYDSKIKKLEKYLKENCNASIE